MSVAQQDNDFGRHAAPKRLLCLATYHKGGTIWMKQVIAALSKALDIPWVGVWGTDPMARVPKTGRAILVNWHGTFPKQLWDDAAAVLLFGIAGLMIAEGSVVQTYKNCMKRVTGNGNGTPLRASGTPTSANAGVAASTAGAPAVNTENNTETQSGSMSRRATTLGSAMSPECSAGASLFTRGAGLCPQ
jgi:hypothetical protein